MSIRATLASAFVVVSFSLAGSAAHATAAHGTPEWFKKKFTNPGSSASELSKGSKIQKVVQRHFSSDHEGAMKKIPSAKTNRNRWTKIGHYAGIAKNKTYRSITGFQRVSVFSRTNAGGDILTQIGGSRSGKGMSSIRYGLVNGRGNRSSFFSRARVFTFGIRTDEAS